MWINYKPTDEITECQAEETWSNIYQDTSLSNCLKPGRRTGWGWSKAQTFS